MEVKPIVAKILISAEFNAEEGEHKNAKTEDVNPLNYYY